MNVYSFALKEIRWVILLFQSASSPRDDTSIAQRNLYTTQVAKQRTSDISSLQRADKASAQLRDGLQRLRTLQRKRRAPVVLRNVFFSFFVPEFDVCFICFRNKIVDRDRPLRSRSQIFVLFFFQHFVLLCVIRKISSVIYKKRVDIRRKNTLLKYNTE